MIYIYYISSSLCSHSVVVGRRPQHAASTSAYVALSSARWYPSSSCLVCLSQRLAGLVLGLFQVVIRSYRQW